MRRRTLCRWLATGGLAGLAGCVGRQAVGDPDEEDGSTATPPRNSIPADSWPSFGGDPGNAGFRPDGSGPDAGAVAWRAIGASGTITSGPTVAEGTVFVGSASVGFDALDAATGERRWDAIPKSYVPTAPTVADGSVYFADADGGVYAYSTGGERQWIHRTERNLHSRSIAVQDGTVFVGTAGTMPAVVSGDTDESKAGRVFALDADSGEKQWSFGGRDWFTGPAFGDGRVYVGNHAGPVYALDAASGEEVWSRDPPGGGGRGSSTAAIVPPTAHRGTLYVPVNGYGVAALDWTDGSVRWSTEFEHPNVKSSPAVGDGRVYLGSAGSQDHPVGEPTPSTTTTEDDGFFGGYTVGNLHALDAATGDRVWKNVYDHDVRSSPAVVGGVVYVGGGDGLHAVTTDGEDLWHVTFGDYVDTAPAVVDGRAYVGSADGNLYCVGEA